jgi:hypothetical protein
LKVLQAVAYFFLINGMFLFGAGLAGYTHSMRYMTVYNDGGYLALAIGGFVFLVYGIKTLIATKKAH